MSGPLLRGIIAFVFVFHGVGHATGIVPAWGMVKVPGRGSFKSWSSRSWLLTGLLSEPLSRILCIVLYGAALAGFLAAALALLGWVLPHDWWRPLAVVSSVISLVAMGLYWNALVFSFLHKVGDLAVNVATLVCLLVLNWPAEADLGF